MRRLIFIRHGDLIRDRRNDVSDELTKKAELYSLNLTSILEKCEVSGLNNIYFDTSDNNLRCYNTIKYLSGNFVRFKKHLNVQTILSQVKEGTDIICYRLESLKDILFQMNIEIDELLAEKEQLRIINRNSDRPDFLYEYIFQVDADGTTSSISKWIKTGTFKGDK